MVTKEAIRQFWDGHPLMSGETDLPPKSRAFFEFHEQIYRRDVFAGADVPAGFFPFAKGARVLDVGCGPGFWTRELARRGYEVAAVDLTDTAVRLAQRSLALFGLAAEVRQGDAENLPFAAESFDGVVSHGVIHHTPDTARCVAEMARVLRPGGLAVVSVYYRNAILRHRALTRLAAAVLGRMVALPGRGRERLLVSGDPDEIVRMYDGSGNPLGKAFTRAEFRAMFAGAGLHVVDEGRFYIPLRGLGRAGAVLKPLHRTLSRRFGLMQVVVARKDS